MKNSVRRTTGTAAIVATLLLTAACGSGDGPFTSKVPLSKLGPPVVKNGQALADKAGSTFDATAQTVRPGTHDLRCAGGHQRRFAAKISAAVPSADEKDLDSVLQKLASSTLDPSGYHLVSKGSTTTFQTKPSSPGERRTVITIAHETGSHFTWTVRAHTACIKKS